MKKKLRQTLLKTKFKETPIVGIAANTSAPSGIEELTKELCSSVFMPLRNVDAPFLFAVDHCFAIKGKGTVMTGTILQGKVQTNNVR